MTSISRLELLPFSLLHHTSAAARLKHQISCRLLCRSDTKLYHIASLLSAPNQIPGSSRPVLVASASDLVANAVSPKNVVYTVADFMTRKEELHVVKSTTTVDEALEMLVENRITGFPLIDDDWKLTFNEIPKLLSKTNGQVVGNLMTSAPVVVRETTSLDDAISSLIVRLLLETKYRCLPVVDGDGKLVGIITRGNVVSAALQIKRTIETA